MHYRMIKMIGGLATILFVAGGTAFGVSLKSAIDRDAALNAYRARSHNEAALAAKAVASAFDQIYENLRTISLLASVRRIDRHGESLSADGRQAIQQIFNNLAGNIAVSEVYIVPADLDPDAFDPKTGTRQAPILMIDKVRRGLDTSEPEDPVDPNAPVQEEIYEYRAFRTLMAKLRGVAPTLPDKSSDIGLFALSSVITCDNSVYNATRRDADRTGALYSVPFYGEDNRLKGTVSAIVLDSAVSRFLPPQNYALIDASNQEVFGSPEGGQQISSAPKVARSVPDDALFYSEVIPVKTNSPNGAFSLWVGRPRAEFLASDDMVQIRGFTLLGHASAGAMGIVGFALMLVLRRLRRNAEGEARLRDHLKEQTAEIDARAADQARETARSEELRRQIEARHQASATAAAAEQAVVIDSLGIGLAALASGNLRLRIETGFASHYEKLRVDFNAAMETLQNTMTMVAANTAAIGSGSDEISSASDDLSRRTEQQAASLEETAAALDEITATVRKTAEGSKHAREVVGQAKQAAEDSGQVVRQAVDAMSGIEKSANQIGNIIGVIDEIAFQTNLLALNAGVEAARAGDAGRGFAVVASEVRALAQRSAEAAKEIKTLISASSQQVERGVCLVGETGQALERIVAQVAEINGIVSEIAASAQEQATGLDQVNTAVNQMDQVTQQNAAMVEQSTAASHALARETEELARLIGQFEIGERSGGATPIRATVRSAKPASGSKPVAAMKTLGRGGAARKPAPEPQASDWQEF